MPNITPVSFCNWAVEPPSLRQRLREYVLREINRTLHRPRRHERLFEHVDTGVDGVAEDLAPCRFFEESCNAGVGVGKDDAIRKRIRVTRQNDRRIGFPLKMKVARSRKIN